MFKHFRSEYPKLSESLQEVSALAGIGLGTVALTHYAIKNEPPEIQQIYWDNLLDPEGCKKALRDYKSNKMK